MSTETALADAATAFAKAILASAGLAPDAAATPSPAPSSAPAQPVLVSPPPPPPIGATHVITPGVQITFNVDPASPPTLFTWPQMPWIYAIVNGFRVGVDRLDVSPLLPDYKGTDPVKDGFAAINASQDGLGSAVVVDVDGPGGNWGNPVVILNGIMPWTVDYNALFNGLVAPAPPPLDMSKLTLIPSASDEFDGVDIDWNKWKSIWNYTDPKSSGCNLPSNGEKQWYVNHDFPQLAALKPWYLKDGALHLVADKLPDTAVPLCGYTTDANYPLGSYHYYAGMLQNSKVCSQTYGYFEVGVTMPTGQGLWPAFWLLPNDGSWPPELDIFEQLGKDPSIFYFTKHWVDGGGKAEGVAVHVDTTQKHRIGMWWDKDFVVLYVDGIEKVRMTNTNLHQPMYAVLNLAVGGNWGGDPDASTVFPAELVFDYLRVYSINP